MVVTVPPDIPSPQIRLVTVPVPEAVIHDGLAAAPPLASSWPLLPGVSAVHADAFR